MSDRHIAPERKSYDHRWPLHLILDCSSYRIDSVRFGKWRLCESSVARQLKREHSKCVGQQIHLRRPHLSVQRTPVEKQKRGRVLASGDIKRRSCRRVYAIIPIVSVVTFKKKVPRLESMTSSVHNVLAGV